MAPPRVTDNFKIADEILHLMTSGRPTLIQKAEELFEIPNVIDLSTSVVIRSPIIQFADRNWRRFCLKFTGSETILRKKVDEKLLEVKKDAAFGTNRYELCYHRDWEKHQSAGGTGQWVTSEVVGHQHLPFYHATLYIACGRTWTLWHVDFDPAAPAITTVVCGMKLWFICEDMETAKRLCKGDSQLRHLLYMIKTHHPDMAHVKYIIQRAGDSIVLPFCAAHCVLTFSDSQAHSETTSMLSYVIPETTADGQKEKEKYVSQRFAVGSRKFNLHGN